MEIEKLINRINELYHKSQDEGLTPEEAAEQKNLRQAYVANIRANLKSQLDSIDIKEADGSITNLGEKHDLKEQEARGNDMYLETLGKNAVEAKYTIGLLSEETRMPVYIAEEPLECVVRGTGKVLMSPYAPTSSLFSA
ncbi:MAG: DUF896 domain-containing protein, partial [Lachnospiraceae bacterium]|nr:DUF896 domain-containing protein [Lachnospiraceae bacterium]